MTISKNIKAILHQSSWIRKMFEEGARLKKIHGPENVYDFSLGNPNLDPPEEFLERLKNIVHISGHGDHAYMPNAGYPHVRNSIAAFISKEHQINITGDDIIMTCGAAGALNVILKAILDAGDEVITTPMTFVATVESIILAGAKPKFADINADTWNIDREKIERAYLFSSIPESIQ